MEKGIPIGAVANMLGVTPETIRYYEKRKIALPSYVGENGYRYYTRTCVSSLFKVKYIQSLGFPLVTTFFRHSTGHSKEEWIQKLNAQRDKLQREIDKLIEQRDMVENYIAKIKSLKKQAARYEIVTAPDVYFCQFSDEFDNINCNAKRIKKIHACIKAFPYAQYGFVCTKEQMQQMDSTSTIKRGFLISEDDAQWLDVDIDDSFKKLPAQQYLTTVISHGWQKNVSVMNFSNAIQYIQENGLTITGPAYGKWIVDIGGTQPEDLEFYYDIWIPVRPAQRDGEKI